MVSVKCTRCGATAEGTSMDDARSKIDHAPGLARGIPCGDNFNQVFDIISETPSEEKIPQNGPPDVSLKTDSTSYKVTDSDSYKKVTGKSAKNIKLDESKPTKE